MSIASLSSSHQIINELQVKLGWVSSVIEVVFQASRSNLELQRLKFKNFTRCKFSREKESL